MNDVSTTARRDTDAAVSIVKGYSVDPFHYKPCKKPCIINSSTMIDIGEGERGEREKKKKEPHCLGYYPHRTSNAKYL